jgi:hypothetical protein
MLWLGFEPTIPAFDRAKRVYALDRAATVIGCLNQLLKINMRVDITERKVLPLLN